MSIGEQTEIRNDPPWRSRSVENWSFGERGAIGDSRRGMKSKNRKKIVYGWEGDRLYLQENAVIPDQKWMRG